MRWRVISLIVAGFVILVLICTLSCTTLRCVTMSHSTRAAKTALAQTARCGRWVRDDDVEGMKVYVAGNPSDPPLILLHEIDGLHAGTVCLGTELAKNYRVYMPLFFGKFGHHYGLVRQMFLCAGPNFNCISTKESAVVAKLRTLRDRVWQRSGKQRMGIIGMCLTGSMPLALADDKVAAVVVSQPAIPFPFTSAERRSLGLSYPSLANVINARVYVLRIRFQKDCLVPLERFDAIAAIPEPYLETEVVPSGDPHEHSVLTVERAAHNPSAEKAVTHLFRFLDQRLGRKP